MVTLFSGPRARGPPSYRRRGGQYSSLGPPRAGASWEGFVIEQTLQTVEPTKAYFGATPSGVEVGIFLIHRGRRYGIEVKFAEAPKTPVLRRMRMTLCYGEALNRIPEENQNERIEKNRPGNHHHRSSRPTAPPVWTANHAQHPAGRSSLLRPQARPRGRGP